MPNIFKFNLEDMNSVESLPNISGPLTNKGFTNGRCPVDWGISVHGTMESFRVMAAGATSYETNFLFEYGKLFMIDYKIKDLTGNVVEENRVKLRFVDDSYDVSGNSEWIDIATPFLKTQEKIIYNEESKEIVIANSVDGTPSIRYFNLNGEEYCVTLYTTSTHVTIEFGKN